VVRIGVGEEDVELARPQLAFQRGQLGVKLAGQLLVVRRQLVQLDQVFGAALEPVPGLALVPQVRCLAGVLAGLGRVVPDPGLG